MSEAERPSLSVEAPDDAFPIPVRALGRECVLIPAEQYQAPRKRHYSVSRLDKTAGLRAFVIERLGRDELESIRLQAVRLFGADRVPSKSAFNRETLKLRGKG